MKCRVWQPILLACAFVLALPIATSAPTSAPTSIAAQEKSVAPDASLAEWVDVAAAYDKDLKALGTDLLEKLDAELAKERSKPEAERNLEIAKHRLEYLEKDRDALLERGEWPSSISVAEIKYRWTNDHRAKVREAYRKASAAAAQRGDGALQKKLDAGLLEFDRTNDLAPWQDLARYADLGQGEQAWSRVGDIFTCPAKGAAGGARNPLRFRRAFPSEYDLRYAVKWMEGDGGLILGLVDSLGQQFELTFDRPTRGTAASAAPASDLVRVAVEVRSDRLSITVDGRREDRWSEGQDFPVETDAPIADGQQLFLGSNDANTRFKVYSAELKCLSRVNGAPRNAEVRSAPPTPRQTAVRYDKPSVLGAILHGIDWLMRHQSSSGGWNLETYTDACPSELPCIQPGHAYSKEYDTGVTGLATVALLRARDQLAKTVNLSNVSSDLVDLAHIDAAARAGVAWLVKRQKPDGSLSGGKSFVYNETLGTLALAEAYGRTKNVEWREPAQRAVDFLVRAQRTSPKNSVESWGWRYAPRMEVEDPSRNTGDENYEKVLHESDTSATGWAIIALKAAERAGLAVKKESLDGALEFTKSVTADNGLVGYVDRETAGQILTGKNDQYVYHPAGMSALGVCIRLYARRETTDPFIDLAARRIAGDPPLVTHDKLSVDYYYWYCGTVALDQLDGPDSTGKGGKYWNPWNKALVEALLPLQDNGDLACWNGSWLIPDRWSFTGGPIYATAINVLTLEGALGWK